MGYGVVWARNECGMGNVWKKYKYGRVLFEYEKGIVWIEGCCMGGYERVSHGVLRV